VTVEGENYTETNFENVHRDPPIEPADDASGGRQLKLTAPEDPPEGGYQTTYEVTAPSAGYYAFDVVGSPFQEHWVSTFEYRVDGGEFTSPTYDDPSELFTGVFDYQAGTVYLEEGTNTFTVRVDERRRINDRDRYVFVFDRFRFRPVPLTVESIVGSAPMNVFTSGESVDLEVSFNHPTTGDRTVTYELVNYDGETVEDGSVSVDAEAASARVAVGSMPHGHYTVTVGFEDEAGSWSEYLGVVTPPAERADVDHPFASMSGASRHIPHDRLDEYGAVIERGGLSTLREISVRWNDGSGVNPARGEFDWSFFDRWLPPLGEATDLLYVNPNTPSWARESENQLAVADDLFDAYDFVRNTASRYAETFSAWEIDNEPELHGIVPHRLGAYIKMSAIAVSDSNADLPVVLPGWAANSLLPGSNETVVTAFENEIGSYVDVYNLHAYQLHERSREIHPTEHPAIQYHQALRARYGMDDLPLWITEAGIRIRTEGGVPMTEADLADQARFIVTSAITAIGLGVEKYFWFVYHNNPTRRTKFGTFARGLTPRPSLVAYAVLSDVVADGDYAGVVQNGPDGVEGHLFERADGGEVAVLWSDQQRSIELPVTAERVREIESMGARTDRTAGGSLSVDVGPDPLYLVAEESLDLETAPFPAATDEAAIRTGNDPAIASRPPGRSRPTEPASATSDELTTAQRVVLAPLYPTGEQGSADTVAEKFGYDPKSRTHLTAGRRHPVTLEVYNTNDRPVSVDLQAAAGDGWRVTGGPDTVEVGATSRTTASFELAPERSEDVTVVDQRPAFIEFWGTVESESIPRSTSLVVAEGALTPTFEGTSPAFEVTLENPADRARTVRSVEWSVGGREGSASLDATVPSNGSETITVPVSRPDRYYTSQDATVRVTFEDADPTVVRDEVTFSPIPAGSASDLPPIRAPEDGIVAMNAVAVYDGGADARTRTRVWHTADALHVRARITDDTYFPDSASESHQRPHDTMVIALEEYAIAVDDYADGGVRLSQWTGPDDSGDGNQAIEDADASIDRTGDGGDRTVDVAIPWSVLDAIDRETSSRLTLWSIDDDGAVNKGRVWWTDEVFFLDGQPE
jgi:hypothetical protein